MPVPSSGQLRLRADINQEVNGNNTDTNVSLGTLSNDAGFTEPDNMSDFYGYSSCGTPAFRTTYSSANPNGDIQLYTILDYTPYCNTTEYGLYVGTNSSGPTANTKYVVASGSSVWGIYQWRYPTVGGFSNNTTYYAWIYATNSAGKTGYSSMQTVTVPAPYVPVTNVTLTPTGDHQNGRYCPNYNFNGGVNVSWYNNTSNQYMQIYGDGNFSNSNPSYPNCQYTTNYIQPDPYQKNTNMGLTGTCVHNTTCGNNRTIYIRIYYTGYSDRVYSSTTSCQIC